MPYKKHVKIEKMLSKCANFFFEMPVFPILRPKVHILRKFLKILRRCASARLQLLEALSQMETPSAMACNN